MKKERKRFRYKREYTPVILAFVVLVALMTVLYFVLDYEQEFSSDINELEIQNTFEEKDVDLSKTDLSNKEISTYKSLAGAVDIEYGYVTMKTCEKPEGADRNTIVYCEITIDDLLADFENNISNDSDNYLINKYFYIKFRNLTDDVYAIVSLDKTDKTTKIEKNENSETSYFLTDSYIYQNVYYTVKIYNKNGTLIRTLSFEPPVLNIFRDMYPCYGNEDIPECHRFVETDITYDELIEKVGYDDNADPEIYIKKREKAQKSKVESSEIVSLTNNHIIFYILLIVIFIIFVIYFIVKKVRGIRK